MKRYGKLSLKAGLDITAVEFQKLLSKSGYSGSSLEAWNDYSKTIPKKSTKKATKKKAEPKEVTEES